AGEGAGANQFAAAHLFARAAHVAITGMRGRQTQWGPNLEDRTGHALAAGDILPVRLVVVEEIKLDELDALIFEIEERTIDATSGGTQMVGLLHELGGFGGGVAGAPVVGPIHPRRGPELHSQVAAAANGGGSFDFALEP